jgi:hypothetical protein
MVTVGLEREAPSMSTWVAFVSGSAALRGSVVVGGGVVVVTGGGVVVGGGAVVTGGVVITGGVNVTVILVRPMVMTIASSPITSPAMPDLTAIFPFMLRLNPTTRYFPGGFIYIIGGFRCRGYKKGGVKVKVLLHLIFDILY